MVGRFIVSGWSCATYANRHSDILLLRSDRVSACTTMGISWTEPTNPPPAHGITLTVRLRLAVPIVPLIVSIICHSYISHPINGGVSHREIFDIKNRRHTIAAFAKKPILCHSYHYFEAPEPAEMRRVDARLRS